MQNVKEAGAVGIGFTAPAWIGVFNEYVGFFIGIATLVYAVGRVYFLFKNQGERA